MIDRHTTFQVNMEDARNKFLQRIYGASKGTSAKIMQYLSHLPIMRERINALRAQYIFHSFTLSPDAFLKNLILCTQKDNRYQLHMLLKVAL